MVLQSYLRDSVVCVCGGRRGRPAVCLSVSVSDLWFQSSARGEKLCAGVYEMAPSPVLEGSREWVDVPGMAGVPCAGLRRISLWGLRESQVGGAV